VRLVSRVGVDRHVELLVIDGGQRQPVGGAAEIDPADDIARRGVEDVETGGVGDRDPRKVLDCEPGQPVRP